MTVEDGSGEPATEPVAAQDDPVHGEATEDVAPDGTARVEHESDPAIELAARSLGLASTDHGPMSMYFGGVGAAYRAADGRLEAAGDPRRAAEVALLP